MGVATITRRLVHALALSALLGTVLACAPARAADLISARLKPGDHRAAIPAHFLGISMEFRQMTPEWDGTGPDGINPAFLGILRNLAVDRQGAPVMRIGAGTADATWWNPFSRPKPKGVAFDLMPG